MNEGRRTTNATTNAQPTLLIGSSTLVAAGDCALLLRMPTSPTTARTLGARAILLSSPEASASQRKAAAERALNLFDQGDGSAGERARNVIVTLREQLGERSEFCMVGLLRREAWAASSGSLTAVASLLRESRHVTVLLPSGAPGATSKTAQRQGVITGRVALATGDRIALAVSEEEARALLKRRPGAMGDTPQLELLLANEEPTPPPSRTVARTSDTLLTIPADNIAQAKARARARWEEGNDERSELIAAAVPPKPEGDRRRPESPTEPYTPIDRAAQAVLAERRGGGPRGGVPTRGPVERAAQPSREARSREAIRRAAQARAERSPGAEPAIERSRAERGSRPPSPLQVATRRLVSAAERRLPWLASRVPAPSLDVERKRDTSPEKATVRGRRRSATVLLVAILITATGGAASVYLNRSDPTLDAVANAREALAEASRAVEEALNPVTNLLASDPERARTLLVGATEKLITAENGGASQTEISALRERMEPALDKLFLLTRAPVFDVFDFSSATVPINITAITQGPDGYSYILDDYSGAVYRVDPAAQPNPRATVVYQPGYELFGSTTGRAQTITASGPDILIFDTSSNLWRWRPADLSGKGTLVKLRVRDGELWGNDVKIISGFAADEGTGLYRIYVVDPSARQILRYTPAPDGTGYPAAPTGYLINPASLTNVDAMAIDGDLYLAQGGAVQRYVGGSVDEWAPADPGDSVIRRAPEIRLIMSAGASRTGVLYGWDTRNQRMLAYSKGASGSVLAQYQLVASDGVVADIVGGYIALARDGGAPTFIWAESGRIRGAVLGSPITPGASPTPAPTAVPVIELPSSQP
jgi:hypothetical protein